MSISRNTNFTYKAMTVVTGLTTVYCNTPSLHLNSKTLFCERRGKKLDKKLEIVNLETDKIYNNDLSNVYSATDAITDYGCHI